MAVPNKTQFLIQTLNQHNEFSETPNLIILKKLNRQCGNITGSGFEAAGGNRIPLFCISNYKT